MQIAVGQLPSLGTLLFSMYLDYDKRPTICAAWSVMGQGVLRGDTLDTGKQKTDENTKTETSVGMHSCRDSPIAPVATPESRITLAL